MSAHDYHEGAPGFDERQIWHDGCGECEWRGEHLHIGSLDGHTFERAWQRAAEWNRNGGTGLAISRAEKPLLDALWSVQVQLERRGWPLGLLPTAERPLTPVDDASTGHGLGAPRERMTQ